MSVASPSPGAAKDATPMKSISMQTSNLSPGSMFPAPPLPSPLPGKLLLLLLPGPNCSADGGRCKNLDANGGRGRALTIPVSVCLVVVVVVVVATVTLFFCIGPICSIRAGRLSAMDDCMGNMSAVVPEDKMTNARVVATMGAAATILINSLFRRTLAVPILLIFCFCFFC